MSFEEEKLLFFFFDKFYSKKKKKKNRWSIQFHRQISHLFVVLPKVHHPSHQPLFCFFHQSRSFLLINFQFLEVLRRGGFLERVRGGKRVEKGGGGRKEKKPIDREKDMKIGGLFCF